MKIWTKWKNEPFVWAFFAALTFAVLTPAALRATFPSADHLTFAAPVALPGVTLGAGAYSFRVNYVDAGNVVHVRRRDSQQVVFQGFTRRVQRPRDRRPGTVVLGEARNGQAAPILVWYPATSGIGFEFEY